MANVWVSCDPTFNITFAVDYTHLYGKTPSALRSFKACFCFVSSLLYAFGEYDVQSCINANFCVYRAVRSPYVTTYRAHCVQLKARAYPCRSGKVHTITWHCSTDGMNVWEERMFLAAMVHPTIVWTSDALHSAFYRPAITNLLVAAILFPLNTVFFVAP